MSLLTGVFLGLLVWLVLLLALTALFVLATRGPRRAKAARVEARRAPERRSSGDRRIGLPDPRPVPTERRRGADRRRAAAA